MDGKKKVRNRGGKRVPQRVGEITIIDKTQIWMFSFTHVMELNPHKWPARKWKKSTVYDLNPAFYSFKTQSS